LDGRVRAPELAAIDIKSPPACLAPVTRTNAANEPRPSVEPLDGERARLHITVSRRLLAKLDAAKAALSHSHPGASSEEVLEAALNLLLAQRAKQKGIVEKSRKVPAAPVNSEAIPAAVKREVWTRAGGRCEWQLESDERCGSTLRLEFDHILPRALGGPSTVDNLRVVCRAHNQLAARQAFGDEWMDRFTRAARSANANAARPRCYPAEPEHPDHGTSEGPTMR
jgi:5-methylcytosine-specific restriction endonuclease McrA